MPKTNFCRDLKKEKKDQRMKAVKEMINGKSASANLTVDELARKTGINPRTLYLRKSHPETIRLEELWAIIDVLKPEEFYLQKIIN